MRITLATSRGLRVVGGSEPDPLSGRRVIALEPAEGCLWALVGSAADRSTDVVRLDADGAHVEGRFDSWTGTCLGVGAGGVWIGTSEAHVLRLVDGRIALVESFDDAPGRSAWYTPWGAPPDTRSMAAAGDRLYVNVHVGGVLRTLDGGATWAPTLDVDDDVHQVTVASDGIVWAATGASALAESRDGGESWRYHDRGLEGHQYLRCVAEVSDGLLVTASSGPHAHDGAVYRFDGEGFRVCDVGLPARFDGNIDTFGLSARGDLAAVAGLDNRVYLSEDAGRTWTLVTDDVHGVRAVVVS